MTALRLTENARKDLLKFDKPDRKLVAAGLLKIQAAPDTRGLPLSGQLKTWRKLVVGKKSIRIIFKFKPEDDIVVVSTIGWRRNGEVYRIAAARLGEDPHG